MSAEKSKKFIKPPNRVIRAPPIEKILSDIDELLSNESAASSTNTTPYLVIVEDEKEEKEEKDADYSQFNHLEILYKRYVKIKKCSYEHETIVSVATEHYAVIQNNGNLQMAVKTFEGNWIIQNYNTIISNLERNRFLLQFKDVDEEGKSVTKKKPTNMFNLVIHEIPIYIGAGCYAGKAPRQHLDLMFLPKPVVHKTILHFLGQKWDLSSLPHFHKFVDNDNVDVEFDDIAPLIGACIQPIINHITMVFANGNKMYALYIIMWLRDLLVNPGTKPGVALIIRSEKEGAGKGIFFHWFNRYVIGKLNSLFTNKAKDLGIGGDYNSLIEGKLLIVLDEFNKKNGAWANMKTIMNMITEPVATINKKYAPQYECEDFSRYVILCNDDDVIKASDSARRYFATECSNIAVGNREYFNDLNFSLNPFTGALFAYFLYNMEEDPEIDIRTPPETPWLKRLKEASWPTPKKFLRDVVLYKDVIETLTNDDEVVIPSTTMFNDFKMWIKSTNEYGNISQTKFTQQMNSILSVEYKKHRTKDGPKNGWKLSRSDIAKSIEIDLPDDIEDLPIFYDDLANI